MIESEISFDTKGFEVYPELDRHGILTAKSSRRICGALDRHGFVILPGLLTQSEADSVRRAIRNVLDDPSREKSAFASEIDIECRRRDFCPPPANSSVLKHRKKAMSAFRLVQVSPAKGTVVFYRSDVFHAGPDNRSELPRYLLSVNLARDMVHPELWGMGCAPHKTLLENPLTLADLLNSAEVARA